MTIPCSDHARCQLGFSWFQPAFVVSCFSRLLCPPPHSFNSCAWLTSFLSQIYEETNGRSYFNKVCYVDSTSAISGLRVHSCPVTNFVLPDREERTSLQIYVLFLSKQGRGRELLLYLLLLKCLQLQIQAFLIALCFLYCTCRSLSAPFSQENYFLIKIGTLLFQT